MTKLVGTAASSPQAMNIEISNAQDELDSASILLEQAETLGAIKSVRNKAEAIRA